MASQGLHQRFAHEYGGPGAIIKIISCEAAHTRAGLPHHGLRLLHLRLLHLAHNLNMRQLMRKSERQLPLGCG